MTTTTRSRGVEAFEHVITNVLKLDKNSQLGKALEDDGFKTITITLITSFNITIFYTLHHYIYTSLLD